MGPITTSKNTVTTEEHAHAVTSTARPVCTATVRQLLTKPVGQQPKNRMRRTG